MRKKLLWSVFGLGSLLASAQVAFTASDSQQFTVTVPQRVTLTAPTPTVSATLPDSSANLVFPAQHWVIKGNVRNGVTVAFKTLNAFENSSDSSFKRDARISLSYVTSSGPANWFAAGMISDSTNYVGGDLEAQVSIASDNAGQHTTALTVEFLTVNIDDVLEGAYATTIEGTVTEN